MSAVSDWEPCGTIIPRKTRKHSHNVKLISVEKVLPNSKQKDLNLNKNCQIINFCLHFIFADTFSRVLPERQASSDLHEGR